MANRIAGLSIEISGETTKLNKALAGTNKEIKDTKSQLRDVERLLKLDPTNTQLLEQKQRLLAEAVTETKSKLGQLKDAEKQVQEQMAKGDVSQAQYEGLQREIIATEKELKSLESAAAKSNATLANIAATADKVAAGANKISSALAPVTAAVGALGVVSFKAAADTEDAIGATEQIYKDSAAAVQAWAKDLESYYGIAYGDALEYSNMMGSMLQNIGGLSDGDAAKQAQELIELAGDLTAMYGGSVSDAVTALTGALKGNNTMLDNYGMAVNDALIKQKAMEMGLISTASEMGLAEKQAATLALIMEQTGAAQGQAAREAEGASGSLRTFTTEAKNLASSFGEVLLPMFTPVLQSLNEFMQWLGSLDEGTQQFIVTIALLVAGISPVAGIVGKVAEAVSFMSATVLPALSTAMSGLSTTVIPALGAALSTLAANPIVLMIAGIVALVAAIAVFGDQIQAVMQKVDDFLQNIFAKDWTEVFGPVLGGALNKFFENVKKVWDTVKGILDGIIDFIRGVFTGDWERAWEGVKKIFTSIWDALVDIVKAPINGIIELINACIGGINEMINGLNSIQVEVPDWVPGIGGETLGFNIPNIPSIPLLATGGVLSSGSAIVGEAGPELLSIVSGGRAQVTPLTRGAATTALNAAGGGGVTYQIGQIVLDATSVKNFNDVFTMLDAEKTQMQKGLA